MQTVTAADIQKNFGQFREVALAEGVVVTAHGKPSVAIISFAEYQRLKELDRRVLRLEDMSDAQIQEMVDAEIPERLRYNLSDIPDLDK
ncbi:MAG: type II toxin-antitoxin system Phd/YefM family antitoxin [Tagaea sp.]